MSRNGLNILIEEIKESGFRKVTFQMEDCHAWYFDAIDNDTDEISEIKIEKDDYNTMSFRFEGREDWHYIIS